MKRPTIINYKTLEVNVNEFKTIYPKCSAAFELLGDRITRIYMTISGLGKDCVYGYRIYRDKCGYEAKMDWPESKLIFVENNMINGGYDND